MSTTPNKKEQVPNYDITGAKTNASTGTLINSQADLNKYGIDYSPAQREEIANIFRAEADAAYNTARNDYARTMAAEQNTLRDTIRRSQAQSVATGASRGLQAANELSAMLGLQEQAAQGAAQMQGSYAEALANASQKAMEQQNAMAQVGSNIAAADIAGEAQKYSMNMDYMANDPFRVLSMIEYYNSIGDTTTADMLKTVFMTGQGATESQVAANNNPSSYKYNTVHLTKDMGTGESNDWFRFKFSDSDDTEYRVKRGSQGDSTVQEKVASAGLKANTIFLVDSKPYIIASDGKAYEILERSANTKHYNNMLAKMQTDSTVPKL